MYLTRFAGVRPYSRSRPVGRRCCRAQGCGIRLASELEPQHELDLPRVSCPDVIRKEVVIVAVEPVYRRDLPKASAARRRTDKGSGLCAIEVQRQVPRIGQLRVVENIE